MSKSPSILSITLSFNKTKTRSHQFKQVSSPIILQLLQLNNDKK
ncbi:Uncharacterised protein [Vibrio cholerae]|nr:Uncharacterised protein [Vibrio cholerae]CSI33060.1 Uncharacterised protein [Vibrio cholerae]